ncbi:ribokinase [Palleronia sp.]|uniref:ribokinase n=1 Tax=Palleronia sp. TaxID=1940284 RepID=UPI0035C7D2EC
MADIAILGIFAADTAYRASRLPRIGETVLGEGFALNPGGKGSNQAVAAARAGGDVAFLSKIGRDTFGALARRTWDEAGVAFAGDETDDPTGAAFIFVDAQNGDNAIIVNPGAAGTITPADLDRWGPTIRGAKVFVTQLEQPLDAARRGLEIARAAGVRTVLNPAPAADLSDEMLALCDLVTPNESEAALLTGLSVTGPADAEAAARALRARGAGAVIVTLGELGALYHDGDTVLHIPALTSGPVVETTGAGDAFNGGLVTALAAGQSIERALRVASATAGLSVTRAGAAPSMPTREEIDRLI